MPRRSMFPINWSWWETFLLPEFGTLVRVTNVKNNKSVVVRVKDRGPGGGDRVGDLSSAAASKLRMLRSGVVNAKLDVVGMAKAHMSKPRKAGKA